MRRALWLILMMILVSCLNGGPAGTVVGYGEQLPSTLTVGPGWSAELMGTAPAGTVDIGNVVVDPSGRLYAPASSYPDYSITSVLTNAEVLGGTLSTFATTPSGTQYNTNNTNLSLNALGGVFLNSYYGGLLTNPSMPAGPMAVYGIPPGTSHRLFQHAPQFDASGHLVVAGDIGTYPSSLDAVLTDPSSVPGQLSVVTQVGNLSSGGPEVAPTGQVIWSSSSGPALYTPDSTFGVFPTDNCLITGAWPAITFRGASEVFTVGVRCADSTGTVLTNPPTVGATLQVYGVAPTGVTLNPNPVMLPGGRLIVNSMTIPATVFTDPASVGGPLGVFGTAPSGMYVSTMNDFSVHPFSQAGRVFFQAGDSQGSTLAVLTDPPAPGGVLATVATFSAGISYVTNPSVDSAGNVYVAARPTVGTPVIIRLSRALVGVGGIAGQPAIATLPATVAASADYTTQYKIGGSIALAVLSVGGASAWHLRRKRAP